MMFAVSDTFLRSPWTKISDQSSRDISISGFGGHVTIFRCRLLLQSIAGTLFEPQIYRYNFNAVCHSFGDTLCSGFDGHFRLSVIIEIAYGHFLRARSGRKH